MLTVGIQFFGESELHSQKNGTQGFKVGNGCPTGAHELENKEQRRTFQEYLSTLILQG
jgi:hypothetical protein